tara:strand:+ start:238 stop:474 length:237 start_codon:yes stop_codon:yes gene_type:complete
MSKEEEPLTKQSNFREFGGIGPDPINFETYNEFVAANVAEFPEHLAILLPYEGGNIALQILQLTWLSDFWKRNKNLFT